MKKSMFLIAGAALALASCSKDEPVSTNHGNAIDFRAAMQTRATATTTANIAKFFVTAFDKNGANYFSDAEFTKDGSFFHLDAVLLLAQRRQRTLRSSLTRRRKMSWAAL